MQRSRSARNLLIVVTTGFLASLTIAVQGQTPPPTEALAGFDGGTNGFVSQAEFDDLRGVFEERDDNAKGLGPVYNAQSCAECHQNPITGGASQITQGRGGQRVGGPFRPP